MADRKRFVANVLAPSAFFTLAGLAHFLRPQAYRSIMPPQFGNPVLLVVLSGIAETAGGVGLLIPATRRAAAYGLVALLIAVWPANWYMAVSAERFAGIAPAWALWLRVPLQLPLIWWMAGAARYRSTRE